MITIDKLNAFGADTASGLARCCGNEALYLRLVGMIPDEKNFDLLSHSIGRGDLAAAFESAHALKGVLGNLSLTPLYEKASAITELLRCGEAADYAPMVAQIMAQREELRQLTMDN